MPSIKMAANIRKVLSPHLTELTNIQKQLEASRIRIYKEVVKDKDVTALLPKNELSEDYFNKYECLVIRVGECQLNNEWIFKVIGWYNMVPYYKSLV